MNYPQTAIIVHGGALKGSFAAGVLYELSQMGVRSTDLIVGSSASVPTAAYFAAEQFEDIRDIWTQEVGSTNFVNYRKFLMGDAFFNLHYLIGELFRRKYPLNLDKVLDAKPHLLIPLYNYKEGRVEYFSSRAEETRERFWNILQAAVTIHDRYIDWHGPLENFVDADLVPYSLYEQDVVPQGYRTLVILNNHELRSNLHMVLGTRLFLWLQGRHFPPEAKDLLRRRVALNNQYVQLFEKFYERHHPFVIKLPDSARIPQSTRISRNRISIAHLFNQGREAVWEIVAKSGEHNPFQPFIDRAGEIAQEDRR